MADPNPLLRRDLDAEVTFAPGGGYQVVERFHAEVNPQVKKGASLGLRLAFPDAVRLPDEPGKLLPGLLMLELGDVSALRNGTPEQPIVTSKGHRVAIEQALVRVSAGPYEESVTHAYRRASRLVDNKIHTYGVVGTDGPVTFIGTDIDRVEFQTYPGEFVQAGEATSTGWLVDEAPFPRVFRAIRTLGDIEPADIIYT